MIELSIIVPIYNVEAYLNRCIESVLSQSFQNYELILVDDGSPDGCPAICDAYAKKDVRITVIHKKNGGLSDARNAGIKVARGNYLLFLDSDDYLVPDSLKFAEPFLSQGVDFVIGSIIRAYEGQSKEVGQAERSDGMIEKSAFENEIPKLLTERRLNYVHAKFYRSTLIKEQGLLFQDDMLTSAEDTVFNFTFLPYCRSIAIVGAPIHYYMQHTDTLARKFYPDRYQRFLRVNNFVEEKCKEIGLEGINLQNALNERRIYAGIWSMEGILNNQSLSRAESLSLLEEIATDSKLQKAATSARVAGDGDLRYLQKKGAAALLRRKGKAGRPSLFGAVKSKIRNAFHKIFRKDA